MGMASEHVDSQIKPTLDDKESKFRRCYCESDQVLFDPSE